VRILVIEDQEDLREIVVETFREESYATDSSPDGEEGLYKALNWDYDLIILDIMLPILDGWQVLTELRKKKNTPVIMLTALDQVADKIKGLDYGADDYLPKPFDLQELLARSRAIIRREGGERKPTLSIGDIEINTSSQTVTKSGKPVDLTAREYAMAELMVRHRGEVLSRDFLYEHLFDENDESMSNMLDVYTYKLRQKLGKNFIKTRRGQGYLVEDVL